MIKDPELKDKSTSISYEPASDSPFTEGLYILGLVEDQLDIYGEFFNNMYKILDKKHNHQITRNALTMMRGAVFALSTRKQQNPEWKEHCASSLREIFHEWNGPQNFNNDFLSIFREHGEGLSKDESNELKSFWLHYNYFSSIDHHEVSGVLHSLRQLRKDSSLKPKDCYKDDVFIALVKDFFSILSYIIEISKKETK